MKRNRAFLFLLVVGVCLTACSPANKPLAESQLSVTQITAEELLKKIQSEKDVPFLVDVRQPGEMTGLYAKLPNAVNIPQGQLFARLQEIPTDRPVVIICQDGKHTLLAQTQLKKMGYTNIMNLEGGIRAIRALMPLITTPVPEPTNEGK